MVLPLANPKSGPTTSKSKPANLKSTVRGPKSNPKSRPRSLKGPVRRV